MICPKCGSDYVSAQTVTTGKLQKGHGALWWIFIGWWWVPIKWIFFTPFAFILALFGSKKYKLKLSKETVCVCQKCGYSGANKEFQGEKTKNTQPSKPAEGRILLSKTDGRSSEVLNATDYVVFDTETTGLDASKDKVVEVSLLKVSGENIECEYCTLVNPQMHINEVASRIHGIFDEDVADAPEYDQVGKEMCDFLGNCLIIGHNIKFDLGFVGGLVKNVKLDADQEWRYVDTITMAKAAYPNMKNYKLQTLVKELGIETEGAHRARADTLATKALFELCRDKLKTSDGITA